LAKSLRAHKRAQLASWPFALLAMNQTCLFGVFYKYLISWPDIWSKPRHSANSWALVKVSKFCWLFKVFPIQYHDAYDM